MTKPLRIGIIGAGGNTRARHIPGFQAIDGVEVAVVCNRSEASSQKVADAFGIPRIAGDWREVIADPEIDAVCVGTWPYLHAECSIAALEKGKHVLTEARMAMDLAEAEQMLAASRAHPELIAQIVPAPFSFTYDATIQRMLQAGELGEIREVRAAHFMPAAVDPSAPMSWRQDTALSGKNIMTMGIHYETIQRWLVDKDPVWVQAVGTVFTRQRPDPETGELREVGIPENISVTAGYTDGSQTTLVVSSVASGFPFMCIRVDGSLGSLRYDLATDQLYRAAPGGDEHPVEPVPEESHRWQVEADFVASIREDKPVTLTSFADGVRYMRFTERVWESWTHEGMRVTW